MSLRPVGRPTSSAGEPIVIEFGISGRSAYEIAVLQGFVGTEAQWIASLNGDGLTPAEREGVNRVIAAEEQLAETVELVETVREDSTTAATTASQRAVEAGQSAAASAARAAEADAARAAAAEQASAASMSRGAAEAARIASEQAAVAAATTSKYYTTIAAGRAAVADNETFGVLAGGADGLTRTTVYRRDSATTQTAVASLVAASEVDAKQDRVPTARFVSVSDVAYAIDSADGERRVFEIGNDGVARVAALRTARINIALGESLPIYNAAGTLVARIDQSGRLIAGDHLLPNGAGVLQQNIPGWAVAVVDSEGNIAGGWTEAGEFRAIGFDPEPSGDGWPGTISHTVQFAFAEPQDDACTGALISWVTTGQSARVLQYRVEGGTEWQSVASHRSRAWPVSTTLWIHTARLEGLAPDTRYSLRWMGAEFVDTFITPPRSAVRVCIASDWQRSTSGAGSLLDTFGQQMATQDCDLLIFNGDFVVDDGVWSVTMSNRWLEFMRTILGSWRRSGSLIPMAAVLGNHEGQNAAGTSNAEAGGNGTPGPIIDIFSLGFDAEAADYVNRSAWAFQIGREVGFVCYETNHTVTIVSQLAWLDAQLGAMSPNVRHLNVIGHAGTFYARNPNTWEQYNEQARRIKRSVWPIMCKYASKLRAYWVGHEHGVSITPRRRTLWDEALTGAENDLRWVNDPTGGVRQLGSGMVGGATNPLPAGVASLASSLDGSQKMEAALGWDGTVFTVHGGINTTGAPGPYNMWIADYSAAEFNARCIAQTGHQFYQVQEAL